MDSHLIHLFEAIVLLYPQKKIPTLALTKKTAALEQLSGIERTLLAIIAHAYVIHKVIRTSITERRHAMTLLQKF